MQQYKITNKEGWDITDQKFEELLKKIFPNYNIGDSRELGETTMKAYGVFENETYIGRIDAVYRPTGTLITIITNYKEEKGLTNKLISNADFEWEKV